MLSAYTPSLLLIPNTSGRLPCTWLIVDNLSSSPLRITIPSGFIWLNISVLALRIPSLVPRFSRWQSPILVITHMSGCAILDNLSISPKSLIPISRTATSSSSVSLKTVSGSPISLLKLPSVFNTLYFSDKTELIVSLVLVLPTLPVIPTTLTSRLFL